MRANIRLWGFADLPEDHPLKQEGQLLDTLHWTSGDAPLPSLPSISMIERLKTADIRLAINIRQQIVDALTLAAKDISSCRNRSRLVIRDGIALHFDLYTCAEVRWETLDVDLINIIDDATSDLADLNLRATYAAISVDTDPVDMPTAFPVEALGEILPVVTPSVSPSCLTIFDAGTPSLLYLDSCKCQPDSDAVDIWYIHVVSCLAARRLVALLRDAVQDSALELEMHSSPQVSKSLKKDLAIALESEVRLDDLRNRANALAAQVSAITDFRELGIHKATESDPHWDLVRKLDQEYQLYYGETLSVALSALQTTSREVADRSAAFLQLSNLAYNVSIQEALKLLQWLSLTIAAASLLAAIMAIIIAI